MACVRLDYSLKPMNEKTFSVTLTEQEGISLLEMIDVAVKAQGMKVAMNGVVLSQKLIKAFQEANPPATVLPMEAKG